MSIPSDLYQAAERARKASGQSRSAVVQDALRHWLDSRAHAGLVREYEAGYRRAPEGRREIKAAEAAAVRLLSTEDSARSGGRICPSPPDGVRSSFSPEMRPMRSASW